MLVGINVNEAIGVGIAHSRTCLNVGKSVFIRDILCMEMPCEANLYAHLSKSFGIFLPIVYQVFLHDLVLPFEVTHNAMVHHHNHVHTKFMSLLGFSLYEVHGLWFYATSRNTYVLVEVVVFVSACVYSNESCLVVELYYVRERVGVGGECFAIAIVIIYMCEVFG